MSPAPPKVSALSAILFDLDGTLYIQKPVRRGMAVELLLNPLTSGKPFRGLRSIKILRAYRALHEELRASPAPELGATQLARTVERTGEPADVVHGTVDEWMIQRPLERLARAKRAGLDAFLCKAHKSGLKLGVYSDYPVEDKLKALGVREHFSFAACSSDTNIDALKPDPKGFLVACLEWGIAPERVLYVGDREEVDRAGATAAGMPCVLIGEQHAQPSVRDFTELEHVIGLV